MSREQADKNLRDKGLRTLTEIENYRNTVKWVPYNEYMEHIYYHCPSREHDELSVKDNFCDKRIEADKLLREAAYLTSLKHRPCRWSDDPWSQEEQLQFEEYMYNRFRAILKEWE